MPASRSPPCLLAGLNINRLFDSFYGFFYGIIIKSCLRLNNLTVAEFFPVKSSKLTQGCSNKSFENDYLSMFVNAG